MKTYKIKSGKSDKEKEIHNLKDILKFRETINLQCKRIGGCNDYVGLEEIHTWYVDENNILYPEKYISMHYDEVSE